MAPLTAAEMDKQRLEEKARADAAEASARQLQEDARRYAQNAAYWQGERDKMAKALVVALGERDQFAAERDAAIAAKEAAEREHERRCPSCKNGVMVPDRGDDESPARHYCDLMCGHVAHGALKESR